MRDTAGLFLNLMWLSTHSSFIFSLLLIPSYFLPVSLVSLLCALSLSTIPLLHRLSPCLSSSSPPGWLEAALSVRLCSDTAIPMHRCRVPDPVLPSGTSPVPCLTDQWK
ncbi:hypothetical protein XENTR_v10023928 [Xenopus tropicalis]|nr:hypothetical protein XENTR_v10023928 [Xenopus tropicalis]